MAASVSEAAVPSSVGWGVRIPDAGEPPSATATLLWVFLSLNVAVLFLQVRPAAIRRVRASAESDSRVCAVDADRFAHAAWLWQAMVAVWSWALYDVVHRMCCYTVLSAHMLVRRRLLPLGRVFLRDGLWTEWVNWVRFFGFCAATTTTTTVAAAAAPVHSCGGWELPVAGVLDYEQYPEYAALDAARPATQDEVDLYHRVCFAALAITWVTVVSLHSQYALVRRLFFTKARRRDPEAVGRDAVDAPAAETRRAEETEAADYVTSLDPAAAPGDDSWVDSPAALAEEALRRRRGTDEEEDETETDKAGPDGEKRAAAQCRRRPTATVKVGPAASTSAVLRQCWPSLASVVYATLYAYVGGLPLLMHFVFPAATILLSAAAMLLTR